MGGFNFRAQSSRDPQKCCQAEILYMPPLIADRSIPRWKLAKLVAGWTKPDPVSVD